MDHPPREAVAFFLRVVCPEEPDRHGSLWPTWKWLKEMAGE